MNIAIAISPIIKVLVLDRDESVLVVVMCHKIHRVVRTARICRFAAFTAASARALGVVVKHGVPADGAATAVLARAWCFAQYDRSISTHALQTAASAFIKHTYQ